MKILQATYFPIVARTLALLLATPAFYLLLLDPGPFWRHVGQGLYLIQALLWLVILRGALRPGCAPHWWQAHGLEWLLLVGALFSAWPPSATLSKLEWTLRLLYCMLVFARILLGLRFLLVRHRFIHIGLLAILCLLAAGLGFYWLEPTVKSYEEGLWLAFTTGATVGYGDVVPTTPAARLFAVFMVILGFTWLSVFTASLAALLIGEDERKLQRELLRDTRHLHAEVAALRAELQKRAGECAAPGSTQTNNQSAYSNKN